MLLVEKEDGFNFLFEQRAPGVEQGGEICFPGGRFHPEKDENYRETALRETVEELGVRRAKLSVIGQMDTIVAPMGATIDSFVTVLPPEQLEELEPEKTEVAETFTVPVEYFEETEPEIYDVKLEVKPTHEDEAGNREVLLPARELGLPERYHKPWGGKKYNIYIYRARKHVIWGITAQLIREFLSYI